MNTITIEFTRFELECFLDEHEMLETSELTKPVNGRDNAAEHVYQKILAAFRGPERLGRHLYQHIERAVKCSGNFNPDENMLYFEEQLTGEEYEKVHGFLSWLHANGRTIGSGNYEQVFSEYKEATR